MNKKYGDEHPAEGSSFIKSRDGGKGHIFDGVVSDEDLSVVSDGPGPGYSSLGVPPAQLMSINHDALSQLLIEIVEEICNNVAVLNNKPGPPNFVTGEALKLSLTRKIIGAFSTEMIHD